MTTRYTDKQRAPAAVYLMLLPLTLGVVGTVLVYPKRRSRGWIMALDEGALIGAIIAVAVAALFLVIAFLAQKRATLWAQGVMSAALGIMACLAVLIILGRELTGESAATSVTIGAALYVVAGILHVAAAIRGVGRARDTKLAA